MAWKIKEEHKDTVIPNIKIPLGKIKPHQIEGLYNHIKEKYFEEIKPKKKKDVASKGGI